MKSKNINPVMVLILCFLLTAGCKKDSPTSPDGTFSSTLSGTITLSGQAFAGIDVYLSYGTSQKKTTGDDGRYSFSNLPSGDFIITPSKKGYSFNPSNYEVGNESRSDLNFTASNAATGTEIGKIATNFTALDQNRNSVSLYDYHGNVILIDFTADWCGPCREKAETAESFFQEHTNKGFVYILLVIEGDPQIWAETYGLTFPVLDDNSQKIYKRYRWNQIPLPHVLDRNCTIRYKKEGWNKGEVEEEIKKYL